jgi:hypothetical protein
MSDIKFEKRPIGGAARARTIGMRRPQRQLQILPKAPCLLYSHSRSGQTTQIQVELNFERKAFEL